MATQQQTYATHVYRPTAWLITWSMSLLAFIVFAVHAYSEPTFVAFALLAVAGIMVSVITLQRQSALRLQNRIIRLEMQVRLARLGREPDLARITLPQLIALRFAADAELPVLIERAVGEQLTPDQIKRAVKEWQGDYLRT